MDSQPPTLGLPSENTEIRALKTGSHWSQLWSVLLCPLGLQEVKGVRRDGRPTQEQRQKALSFPAIPWTRDPKAFPSLMFNKLNRTITTLI